MAYYNNPVLGQQALLARTIQSGLSGLADRPLEKARLSLTEAQLMDQIRRNKAADTRADKQLGIAESADQRAQTALTHNIEIQNAQEERAKTTENRTAKQFSADEVVRNLQREQAKIGIEQLANQKELRDQPLTIDALAPMMFGPEASTESVMDFAANEKLQKILKSTGGSYKDGTFIKANGKPATWADLPTIMAVAGPVLQSDADPGHLLDQKVRQFEDMIAKSGDRGVLTPEDQQWYDQAKKNQRDPNWLIDQYEKQNDRDLNTLAQFHQRGIPTDVIKMNVKRRDGKIGSLQKTVTERRKHENAKELAKINSAGSRLGSLAKDSMFLSEVAKISPDEATNIIRYDKTMADRLRGAAKELEILDADLYEPEALAEKIKEIKKEWGIDSASLKRSRNAAKPEPNNDPDDIRGLLFK